MAIDISKLPLSQLRSLRNCCYNLVIRNLRQCPEGDEKYRKIRILLSQFYLGIVAQNELLFKNVSNSDGLMKKTSPISCD